MGEKNDMWMSEERAEEHAPLSGSQKAHSFPDMPRNLENPESAQKV